MENKKLYSQKAIGLATYLGGPMAAGYLIKKNYQSFGEIENGKKAFWLGIISTLMIFILIFSIPDEIIDKIPNILIPLIYTGIIYLIVDKTQGPRLKEHDESDGEFHSVWSTIGIGLISLLIMFAGIFLYTFASDGFTEFEFDAVTYDNRMAEFSKNEDKALEFFNRLETADDKYLIRELSKDIILWETNKNIVNSLDTISDLPQELIDQDALLLKYCDLRIEQYEIFLKAISENTDKYNKELDGIAVKIDNVVGEL